MPISPFNLFRRSGVVRNFDDAATLGVPVLGSISSFEPRPGARLPGKAYPEALEGYLKLTNAVKGPEFQARGRVIVVTSGEPRAGRSTIAKNLATLLARDGSKVVLVDANLSRVARRRPGDGTTSSGFAGLLVNQLRMPSNSLAHTMDARLKLLPAGSVAGSPDMLLQSTRLPIVIDALRDIADQIVIDVESVTHDLLHLSRLADVTLVAVAAGTSRKKASRAVVTLRGANSGLLGIVLNRAPVSATAPQMEKQRPVAEATKKANSEPGQVEAAGVPPEERLVIDVDKLLANLEASVRLIRDIRSAGEVSDEPEEEEAELVTMDR
jgi:protein-tyrosine kinase